MSDDEKVESFIFICGILLVVVGAAILWGYQVLPLALGLQLQLMYYTRTK